MAHIILMLVVALVVAASVALGLAVGNFDDEAPELKIIDSSDLPQDSTFFVLLAQSSTNVLCSFFEMIKALWDPNRDTRTGFRAWLTRSLFYLVVISAIALSIAAPTNYGVSKRSSRDTQLQTMALSFSSSLCTVIAGLISIFDTDRARQLRRVDEEAAMVHAEQHEAIEMLRRRAIKAEAENERLARRRARWRFWRRV